MNRMWACGVTAIALAGCSSDARLGSGGGSGGAGGVEIRGAGGWGGYGATPVGCEKLPPFEPVQVWTGYREGSSPDSPPIVLRFSTFDETEVSGEVTLGSAGSTGYRVPDDAAILQGNFNAMYPSGSFDYAMLNGVRTGDRVWFNYSAAEPWCAWCGEQTPYGSPDSMYFCAPMPDIVCESPADACVGTDPVTGQESLWSYTMVYMCGGSYTPCQCDAYGCHAASDLRTFDLTIDDPLHATGSLDGSPVRFDIQAAP
jgi:hypothetical protein